MAHYAPSEEELKIVNPPVGNALYLKEDTWWEFHIGITVYIDKDEEPQETILIQICFKKSNEYEFIVKLFSEKQTFSIHVGNREEFKAFFERIYEYIVESYRTGLQNFFEQNTFRKIGYKY